MADTIGRKFTVLLSDIFLVVGPVLMFMAKSMIMLYSGRFLIGLGLGLSLMICNVFLSESAPSKIRGSMVMSNIVFMSLGAITAYVVALFVHKWQWLIGAAALPPALQFILMFLFVSETPSFYATKGDFERAEAVMKKFYNLKTEEARLAFVKDVKSVEFSAEGRND